MKKKTVDYSLYAVLDQEWLNGRKADELADEAIQGGVTVLQYRNKQDEIGDFFRQAERIKRVTDRANIPLIINDRMDVALAVEADGIHVGQSDLPIPILSKWLGEDKLIGISVSHLEELSTISGADYLGVGSVYATGSKLGVHIGGLDLIRAVHERTKLPIVGIGGIQLENIPDVIAAGCDGIAVISAIFGNPDVRSAARKLRNAVDEAKEIRDASHPVFHYPG